LEESSEYPGQDQQLKQPIGSESDNAPTDHVHGASLFYNSEKHECHPDDVQHVQGE
jgi:hypothetical protein